MGKATEPFRIHFSFFEKETKTKKNANLCEDPNGQNDHPRG